MDTPLLDCNKPLSKGLTLKGVHTLQLVQRAPSPEDSMLLGLTHLVFVYCSQASPLSTSPAQITRRGDWEQKDAEKG